jgi:hypothetical protein
MSITETVVRQSNSYRQGLVLGLTMAEAILLIVFALLIALAAVWRAEHQEKVRLEAKLNDLETTASLGPSDPVDLDLIDKFEKLLGTADRSIIATALERIASGRSISTLTDEETSYVGEIKSELQNYDPPEIDQQWRELVAAASVKNLAHKLAVAAAVEQALPDQSDVNNVGVLIGLGQKAQKEGSHDWPPIINLHEADGYNFEKGSAELTAVFEGRLKSIIIPELVQLTQQYGVDIIEVVGHTDEQPVSQRTSNLDRTLLDALNGAPSTASPMHADNAGLGLSRAVSVVRSFVRDGRLPQAQIRILPLSGGQLITTSERITTGGGGEVPSRRRIEIRLRRSQESLGRKQ